MKIAVVLCCFFFVPELFAAPKPHSVYFGRWTTVKYVPDDGQSKSVDMKIRSLIVDGRTKEFTTGPAHDITERVFVVQRTYRLNDLLPQETGTPRWRWERGSWLLVDRTTGKVQAIILPEFDSSRSEVSWFRDFAAYCGISDDGKKAFTVVAQVGKRRALLKKVLETKEPTRGCHGPMWQRDPARVSFAPDGEAGFTFTVSSHAVDLVSDDEGEAE